MSAVPEETEGAPVLYLLVDAAREWVSSHPLSLLQPLEGHSTVVGENRESGINSSQKIPVCKFFLQGKCRFGDKCRNSHGHTPSKKASESADSPQTQALSADKPLGKGGKSKSEGSREKKEEEKKAPMRTSDDVISRILWDPDLPSDDFTVGYLDRFVGIIEKPFSSFSWEDLATVGINVLAVPKHRIQYFKFGDEIVWDKRSQVDDFFGSRGGRVIQDIVAERRTATKSELQCTDGGTKSAESAELIELDIDQEEEEEEVKAGQHVYMDRDRPTHFVCVRITDNRVKENVSKILEHFTAQAPPLREGCLPLTALHVTLCMVRLENDRQISVAQEVMKSATSHFLHILPRCSGLEFTGVSNFRERLVYVKVAPCPALETFVFFLMEQFQAAGLRTPGNHKEYTPHVTLVKLSRPIQRELHPGMISPALYQEFIDTPVGSNRFETLSLCSMSAPKLSDGFYLRLSEISNSLSGLPPQFLSLLKKRLDFFGEIGMISDEEHASLHRAVQQPETASGGSLEEFDTAIEEIIRLGQEGVMCTVTASDASRTPVVVVALRGVPGSGKSHLVTHCSEYLACSAKVAVCSADYFFMNSGGYRYSTKHLPQAHTHCLSLFVQAVEEGKELVVVDNTNVKKWEYEIYKYVSVILGLKFHVLKIPCPSERILEGYRSRNQHNVDQNTALKIFQRWEVNDTASLVPPSLAYPRTIPASPPPAYSLASLCSPEEETRNLRALQEMASLTAVYTAVFLTTESQWKLVSAILPTHPRVRADHVTLVFEPGKQACLKVRIGARVTVSVTGSVDNGQLQVAAVELPRTVLRNNSVPHVTVSAEESVSFKQANEVLQRQRPKPLRQALELEGIIGVTVRERNELDSIPADKRESSARISSKAKQELANQPMFVVRSESDFKTHVLPKLTATLEDAQLSTSIEISTGKQKITTLNVFDFDGTLFATPDPKKGRQVYEAHTGRKWERRGWLIWPESLLPPVFSSPGPALPTYRDHIGQAGSLTVVLTGRNERTRPGLEHVLESFKVYPEGLITKPDSSEEHTSDFKARIVRKMLEENLDVSLVRFWDDNPHNLSSLHRLSVTACKHVHFEIIDAVKMVPTVATKRGKKMKIDSSTTASNSSLAEVEPFSSNLESYLSSCGYLPSTSYTTAADCGVRFITEQYSQLLGYGGDPLHLVYRFGSTPLGRRGDMDMCLLCPSHLSPVDSLKQLSGRLRECGINYVHEGYSTRCPRLKIMLEYPTSCPIDYDIVFASIGGEVPSFFDTPRSLQVPAPEVLSLIKPEDSASKTAFTGAVLMHKLLAGIDWCVPLAQFGAVVEMVVQLLIAHRQKGNACHCIRTFHVVRLLANFIKDRRETLKQTNCDSLFKEFVGYAAEVTDDQWESLFGEFVPVEFIPKVRNVFEKAARDIDREATPSLACYENLLSRRPAYPPEGYTSVEINLSGTNRVELWRLNTIVEARLPSYVRQLVSLGLDVAPDGNTERKSGFSFAVPREKSAKKTLQQVLRPFWNEISKYRNQDGVNVTLNFGQPDENPDSQKSLPAIDEIKRFVSDSEQSEMKIASNLTAFERMLVYETCEQLGLSHTTVSSGREKHIVVRK